MFGFTDYSDYRRHETEVARGAEDRRRDRDALDARNADRPGHADHAARPGTRRRIRPARVRWA